MVPYGTFNKSFLFYWTFSYNGKRFYRLYQGKKCFSWETLSEWIFGEQKIILWHQCKETFFKNANNTTVHCIWWIKPSVNGEVRRLHFDWIIVLWLQGGFSPSPGLISTHIMALEQLWCCSVLCRETTIIWPLHFHMLKSSAYLFNRWKATILYVLFIVG